MRLRNSSLNIIYEYNSKYCVWKGAVEAKFLKSLDNLSNPNSIIPIIAVFMKIIVFFFSFFAKNLIDFQRFSGILLGIYLI